MKKLIIAITIIWFGFSMFIAGFLAYYSNENQELPIMGWTELGAFFLGLLIWPIISKCYQWLNNWNVR